MASANARKSSKNSASEMVKDTRPLGEKRLFPWWWRTQKSEFARKLAGDFYLSMVAYHYELARRYLILVEKESQSTFPSLEALFKRDPSKASTLEHALFEIHVESYVDDAIYCDSYFEISSLDMMPIRPSLEEQIWERCPIFAWNLEVSWKQLKKAIKPVFMASKNQKGVKTISRSTKNQGPYWRRLEIWDFWQANLDYPTFRDGSVHADKVRNIKIDAKKSVKIANYIIEIYPSFM
ncbi:hypothetical protein N8648_03555 [Verrucomicrobia bacterium]|nr:hypothetical protein [Verrucomicrobiota bacterium]